MRMWILLAGVAGAVVWYRRRSNQGQRTSETEATPIGEAQKALPPGSGQGANTQAVTAAREAALGASSGDSETSAPPASTSSSTTSASTPSAQERSSAAGRSESTASTPPGRSGTSSGADDSTAAARGSNSAAQATRSARPEEQGTAGSQAAAPDDRALAQQVRAAIERVASHPNAIDTSEDGATVTLRGAILRREVDRLLRAVLDVPGVRDVENRLDVYDSTEGVLAFENPRGR